MTLSGLFRLVVSPPVDDHVGALHEPLLADVAAEGTLARVDPLVLHQVALLQEGLGAVHALVAPHACVNLVVPDQRLLVGESGTALLAREGQQLVVGAQVPRQLAPQRERHGAEPARERRCWLLVGRHVHVVACLVGEGLAADAAAVALVCRALQRALVTRHALRVHEGVAATAAPDLLLLLWWWV